MGPQFMIGGTAIAAFVIALLVLIWSPWEEGEDVTPSERIAQPTPALAGSPVIPTPALQPTPRP
jgi:hypothetical protein